MKTHLDGPSHRRLLAWQEAKALAVLTYEACERQKRVLDRGLTDQIRRAVVSIPSNIAEGNGRGTNKDSLRFLYIARGSLCELETQVEVCVGARLLAQPEAKQLLGQAEIVGRLIGGLIHYRKQTESLDPPSAGPANPLRNPPSTLRPL